MKNKSSTGLPWLVTVKALTGVDMKPDTVILRFPTEEDRDEFISALGNVDYGTSYDKENE